MKLHRNDCIVKSDIQILNLIELEFVFNVCRIIVVIVLRSTNAKFKVIQIFNILNGIRSILIIILRGLKFGGGNTETTIWPDVIIKLQKTTISLNT